MPEMNGKKYPYTKEGMRRYKLDKEKSKKESTQEKPKKGLSPKQKKIASKAGDPNKIEAQDMKELRKSAKSDVKKARKYLKKKEA